VGARKNVGGEEMMRAKARSRHLRCEEKRTRNFPPWQENDESVVDFSFSYLRKIRLSI